MMRSHKEIIDRWPTVAEFAEEAGIRPSTARAIKTRNSIPLRHWEGVIAAAQKRGFTDITTDLLLKTRNLHDEGAEPETPTAAE